VKPKRKNQMSIYGCKIRKERNKKKRVDTSNCPCKGKCYWRVGLAFLPCKHALGGRINARLQHHYKEKRFVNVV